jgi:outer membrane protein
MDVKSRRMMLVSLAATLALLAPVSPRAAEDEPADAVRMSLSECLSAALERNLDLEIARRDPEIAYQNVLFQKAAFDALFSASGSHNDTKQEPSQVFTGRDNKQDNLNATFSGLFNFGATWSAGLATSRYDTDSLGALYNPSYNSGLALGFNLPLLKNFGKETTTAQLVISKRNLEISHEELRRQATTTLRSVEDAYWNLRAAREARKVAEQALRLSQDLYDLNKKKVEVGTLAPIEITQAEANVASNVEATIQAKETVGNTQDALLKLLAVPKDDPLWTRTLIPTEDPVRDARSVDLGAVTETALTARPEIIEARKGLENAQLSERAAKNAARHELDLSAGLTPTGNNLTDISPGPDGIPGTADDVPITGGLGDSYKEIPKFNNYVWSLGLSYKVPIANRAAKANYATAGLNREKQEISVKNTEDLIRVDVRTAVRTVESGFERVTAAKKNVELQQKKLDAEQKKFDNGMSTSFEVFTFQTDLRNAQLSLIQALLDYNKGLADLERAKGTLLESKGLKLADDAGK